VDDFSSSEFIAKKLQNFLDTEFQKTKFKIIRLPVRVGPIVAKNTGAKAASGDALVFLDSQVEVTTNWLPPLLNGLVENYKMVTCPIIDNIDPNTFQYIVEDYGNSRLLFDWKFSLKRFPLTGHGSDFITDGHQSPITLGMFAITKKFFQEIEGFDPGLKMYGGENFEISFKTWQCGGEIIELPCSRVGHINRIDGQRDKYNETLAHNLKRVAEV
jgi:polypeptide N-acetylgalactosaminyltransferase